MLSKIWVFMILISILYFYLTGRISFLNDLILEIPSSTLTLFLSFAPLIIFWSGIMEIAKDSKLLAHISKLLKPIISLLFKNESAETKEYISANIAANMLGLGSAATPMGLMAIKNMQDENKDKTRPTKGMITLLLLNTSGLTLVPTYILSVRKSANASILYELIPFILLATFITTSFAIFINKVGNK